MRTLGITMALLTSLALTVPANGMDLGTPTSDPVEYTLAASTNLLNSQSSPPKQLPYVFATDSMAPVGTTAGSIDFTFVGPYAGIAYFEYRLDGAAAGSTTHPVVPADTIHSGVYVGTLGTVDQTLTAFNYIDVRLALGGERDWDFGWTRFDVPEGQAAPIPVPGAAVAGLGLL